MGTFGGIGGAETDPCTAARVYVPKTVTANFGTQKGICVVIIEAMEIRDIVIFFVSTINLQLIKSKVR